jgi:hypothetical protein
VLKNYELECSKVVSAFGHSSWQKQGRKERRKEEQQGENDKE